MRAPPNIPAAVLHRRTSRNLALALSGGLSLVELMVALTISMMVIGAASALYLQSTRTSTEDDRYARMQENGRFALNELAEDLKLAGFYGDYMGSNTPTVAGTLTNAFTDCGVDYYGSYGTALQYNDNATAQPQQFAFPGSCAGGGVTIAGFNNNIGKPLNVSTVAGGSVPVNSDQLLVKRTKTVQLNAGEVNGTVYFRTEFPSFVNDGSPATAGLTSFPGWSDWQYTPRIYFIRDSYPDPANPGNVVPQLCRSLGGPDTTVVPNLVQGFNAVGEFDCLADGVEAMRVEFGFDTDQDGYVNTYDTKPPAGITMYNAIAARVYLLLRSKQPLVGYTNTKSFQLGGLTIANAALPAYNCNSGATSIAARAGANCDYYRAVFSTTVRLRNPASFVLFIR